MLHLNNKRRFIFRLKPFLCFMMSGFLQQAQDNGPLLLILLILGFIYSLCQFPAFSF